MVNRITASIDEEDCERINNLVDRSDMTQSEVVRQAIRFYDANYEAASANQTYNLNQYYQMLSTGEHVLLDIDFLHCFLNYIYDGGCADEAFLAMADRVSDYHCQEYQDRFSDLGDVLTWLSVSGFLTVRTEFENSYYIVFPSESVRWFMCRFIDRSTAELPFDIEIDAGISKAILTERSNGDTEERVKHERRASRDDPENGHPTLSGVRSGERRGR